jgi:hypothetical protein
MKPFIHSTRIHLGDASAHGIGPKGGYSLRTRHYIRCSPLSLILPTRDGRSLRELGLLRGHGSILVWCTGERPRVCCPQCAPGENHSQKGRDGQEVGRMGRSQKREPHAPSNPWVATAMDTGLKVRADPDSPVYQCVQHQVLCAGWCWMASFYQQIQRFPGQETCRKPVCCATAVRWDSF